MVKLLNYAMALMCREFMNMFKFKTPLSVVKLLTWLIVALAVFAGVLFLLVVGAIFNQLLIDGAF